MRTVKVQIQADTAQATSQVRALTSALSQLDAVARQSAGNAMRALNGANPATLTSGGLNDQSLLAAQARVQASQTTPAQKQQVDKVKADGDKVADATKKAAEKVKVEAGKQFQKFADDIGKLFADVFEGLISGGLKGGLKAFKDGLKSMLQGIMKQLIGNISEQIKSAISKKIVSIFDKNKGSGTGTGKTPGTPGSSDAGKGSGTGLPDTTTTVHEAVHSGLNAGAPPSPSLAHEGIHAIQSGINPITPTPITPSTKGTGGTTTGTDGKAAQTAAGAVGGPGKFQTQIASMLPGIGMSLGGMLGMGQAGPSMLGQVGGLLAGGIGLAFLAPGLLTSAFGGTIAGVAGATASTGISGAVAGLLTNPFTIAVAGALIVGAIIWGINSRRRKEEKQRNQAMLDAFSQLDELIKQVNSDQLDGASAINQANQVRKQYVDQMSQLKDKKTCNIALKDVSRIDSKIAQIKQAADQQTARKAMDAKLVPTFADGGFVGGSGYKVLGGDGAFMHPFRGRVPGIYDRRDDFLARLTGNEVVLTPDVWMPIAPYLKQKRVPGFADGGMASGIDSSGFTGSSQASSNQRIIIEELNIHLSNQFGADSAIKVLGVGLKTAEGQKAVVRSVRTHIGESGLGDGLVRDINNVNERGF